MSAAIAGRPLRTRMLKCECGDCGYVARVSRRWLCETGPPICPCNRETMACPQWADIEGELWAEFNEEEAAATSVRPLSDKWIEALRSLQACNLCGIELAHGESARKRVYTVNGEFFSEYTCARCNSGDRRQRGVSRDLAA